ncbi:MAG: hypothetical protein QNJ42_12940 [Crocosphaera sp.]|nr:hypothetical protein [Crocosphaera sp.]
MIGTLFGHIETLEINRYTQEDRAKAFINTWLAWQKKPGMPMGQAITAKVLRNNPAIAQTFVNWLNQLYQDYESNNN